jgi:Flp pilus assembly protein TadB
MTTWLTLLSGLAALLFLGVVAWGLVRIVARLEAIGGRGDSYLARLRLGLRAIERETAHLPGAVPGINAALGAAAARLGAAEAALGRAHAGLTRGRAEP